MRKRTARPLKIKREISWFDPAKYRGLEELDLLSWYLQFAARRMLRLLVQEERQTKGIVEQNGPAYALARQIINKPVIEITDLFHLPFDLGVLFFHYYAPALRQTNVQTAGVRLMTTMELYEQESLLDDDVLQDARSYFQEITPEVDNSQPPTRDFHHAAAMMAMRRIRHLAKDPLLWDFSERMTGLKPNGRRYNRLFDLPLIQSQRLKPVSVPVSVDLRLPDAVLIRDFGHLLADLRARIVLTKRSKPAKNSKNLEVLRKQWIRCHVLQFVDMQAWQILTVGRSFNEAIWPQIEEAMEAHAVIRDPKRHQTKDNSNYRKTNETAADKLMAFDSVHFLLLEMEAAKVFAVRWKAYEERLAQVPEIKRIIEMMSRKDFREQMRLFCLDEPPYRNPQEVNQIHEDNSDVHHRNSCPTIRTTADNRAARRGSGSVN